MKINSDLLRELRLQRGMSQETLAEAAGLSTRTVQRLERGGLASMETAMALAAVFDTDRAALEDSSAAQPSLLHNPERGYRFGMVGMSLGALAAVVGIGLDFAIGGATAAETGLLFGLIGLVTGGISALLGALLHRQQRNLHRG